MRRHGWKLTVGVLLLVGLGVGVTVAQQFRGGGRMGGWRRGPVPITEDRKGVPDWKVDPRFKSDVFTFARVQYDSVGGRGWGRGGGQWLTDFPDSDLNFSYRLQQLTSLKVNPAPVTLRLTDDKLFDYPFIYMIEPGRMALAEDEVVALRKYLLNGGFLMVDDFWGDQEYENFRQQIHPVLNQDPQELPLDHEIFHCVYRLKEKPQVPNIQAAIWGREAGVTWEDRPGSDTSRASYKGLTDPSGRLVAIVCHNTDLGDGWEREGEDPWYFKEFAEKKAYPIGINIVTYAMTH